MEKGTLRKHQCVPQLKLEPSPLSTSCIPQSSEFFIALLMRQTHRYARVPLVPRLNLPVLLTHKNLCGTPSEPLDPPEGDDPQKSLKGSLSIWCEPLDFLHSLDFLSRMPKEPCMKTRARSTQSDGKQGEGSPMHSDLKAKEKHHMILPRNNPATEGSRWTLSASPKPG